MVTCYHMCVKFLQSCWFEEPLLLLVHWASWSPESGQSSARSFQSTASFSWQALWRRCLHFPLGLGTWPHCKKYQSLVQWPWDYWPEPHRDSMRHCQEKDERGRTMQKSWRPLLKHPGLHDASAEPQADSVTPLWGSNSCKRVPNQLLSTVVHKHVQLFRGPTFLFIYDIHIYIIIFF